MAFESTSRALSFQSTLVVAHVKEAHPRRSSDSGALLQRAHDRVTEAGLEVETVVKHGHADAELAALAQGVDAVLVGRRGRSSTGEAIGRTLTSLIRIAERTIIVCASRPSPMQSCAIAYDGRETAQHALELVTRFASITHSTVHIIHATIDPAAGTMVVGEAEAFLSLQGVAFVTHMEHGTPGDAVARVIQQTKCDALFAGAHAGKGGGAGVMVSHAEEILSHTDIPVVIQP